MGPTVIKFLGDSYKTNQALLRSFKELIMTSTGNSFAKAEIIQKKSDLVNPNYAALTLYSQNGFVITINGLHCGRRGDTIVDLLKFCGFKLDDATAHTIISCENIKITLWNN